MCQKKSVSSQVRGELITVNCLFVCFCVEKHLLKLPDTLMLSYMRQKTTVTTAVAPNSI